jgi:methyl-accepting chemotaxis protein
MKDKMMKFTKNMSIGKKMVLGYGVLLTLTIIISVLGLLGIRVLDGSIKSLANGSQKANDAIKMCRIDVNIAARDVREMALNDDTSTYETYQQDIDSKLTDLDDNLAELKAANVVSDEKYQAYADALNQWKSDASTIVDDLVAGDKTKATEMIFSTCVPSLSNLVDLSKELDSEIESLVDKSLKRSRSIYYTSFAIVLIVTLLSVAFTVFLGRSVMDSIVVPLQEIEASAKELSEGNLHTQITYESNDELGDVADSLRESIRCLSSYVDDISQTMTQFADGDFVLNPTVDWKGDFTPILEAFRKFEANMGDTVSGIQQAVSQVEIGSQQVSDTSMELAQGATDQAIVMQQFTSTLGDISSRVSENAIQADDISRRVEEVGGEISITNEKMREMVQSMNEIEESSEKIRQIIDTIDDVAAQTNLLALNASIEAARAGEFGKGFAVVANQVTVLANQSANAAEESTQLIEASIKEVKKGKALTDEIAQQQEKVAVDTQTIVDEVEQVAKNLKSQDESFIQLNDGIVQINDVIQTNSATSEECAASSETMSGQASMLDNLISGFKVAHV